MIASDYKLLAAFQSLFEGKIYKHRDSSLGDYVASFLYEDLYLLAKSAKLSTRIEEASRVINSQNQTIGVARRRGDGTFGELVPAAVAISVPGFAVSRGAVATIEIGAETKILAKAMIKQIDRVIGDLVRQGQEFRKRGGAPICVGLVGVNCSERYRSFEGDREFRTDGKLYKHPSQEADETVSRLQQHAASHFDEFQILRFSATNESPFPFSWVNGHGTVMEYSALLTRICREYDRRF